MRCQDRTRLASTSARPGDLRYTSASRVLFVYQSLTLCNFLHSAAAAATVAATAAATAAAAAAAAAVVSSEPLDSV